MSNKEGIISHIDFDGDNNDIIDGFENYFKDIDFSGDLKSVIKDEIKKLRLDFEDKKINWTQNEQQELKKLFDNVIMNESVSDTEKIIMLVDIMNHKIQNEIRELTGENVKCPKKLAIIIEKNDEIKKYGDISDKYIGKSEYLVVITPIDHGKLLQKGADDISEANYRKLIVQNENLNSIIGELIKQGIVTVYSFEGNGFEEVAFELPNGIYEQYGEIFEKYRKLLEKPEKNKQKIEKLEKQIIYLGGFFIQPEFIHNDDLLSYGVDNESYMNVIYDTTKLLKKLLTIRGKENFNLENEIKYYILNKKFEPVSESKAKEELDDYIKLLNSISEFKTKKEFDDYIKFLDSVLIPGNISTIKIEDYLLYLSKQNLIFTYKMRNEEVVKNLEILSDNTKQKGIMLKFGAGHFNAKVETGIEYIDKNIIPALDIKDIKTMFKEKGISYIEITPKKED